MSLQDTIQQFQKLPPDIQRALSSDEAMAKMEALEGKYNLKLASFVLRAAVREFPLEDLGIVIRKELNLKPEQAGLLKDELLDQIFAPVMSYYAEGADKSVDDAENVSSIKNQVLRDAEKDTRYKIQNTNHSAPPKPPMAPPRPPVVPSAPRSAESIKKTIVNQESEIGNISPVITPRPPQESEGQKVSSSKIQDSSSMRPPQPPKSRSYFYFDAEDEKDVEKFKKHEVVASGRGKEFIERIDKTADEVINHSLVNFSDENGKRRLKSYLTAYFRGIRDILQTKESLARPMATGGMEFNAVTIEKVMALAKEEFHKIHSAGAEKVDEASIKNQVLSSKYPAKDEASLEPKELKKNDNQNDTIKTNLEANQQIAESKIPDTRYKMQDTRPTIRRERPQVIDTDKPKIAEVRLPSKLTGPLEEIEQLNLRDLRRFAQNHQGFADRTMERIKILENESFEKRMMGVAAWRKSMLYQQYLNVIQNSLERNISIPEMIGAVTEAESQNMSLREWQTVNRINRELRA
ncbi:hypothetical protein EPN15_03660 [Patescibacteria group bacterium]|nr:MAG: hypothetical protein EPN15_03660 [Patescibacteria group bacterium]